MISNCSVDFCTDSIDSWAEENCRRFCGYCTPGTFEIGFLSSCFYKGFAYSQGEKLDDGCGYECECVAAFSGRYVCYNKWPIYYNLLCQCTLVKQPGKCCLEPVCSFVHSYVTTNTSGFCEHGLGQVWSNGCKRDCLCLKESPNLATSIPAETGVLNTARYLYTCRNRCAQYGTLPLYLQKQVCSIRHATSIPA